jgi:hypothetical protein
MTFFGPLPFFFVNSPCGPVTLRECVAEQPQRKRRR